MDYTSFRLILMQTKLTLRLDDRLIRKAKRYSARNGKSISRLVADYFDLLESGDGPPVEPLSDRVRSLVGVLAAADTSKEAPTP